MSADLAGDLHAVVGAAGLLAGEDVASRSCDPFRVVPACARLLVRPASTEELSRVMALCDSREKVQCHWCSPTRENFDD